MIALMDHVRKKDLPPEVKCRQVSPPSPANSPCGVRRYYTRFSPQLRTCEPVTEDICCLSLCRSFQRLDCGLRVCGTLQCPLHHH